MATGNKKNSTPVKKSPTPKIRDSKVSINSPSVQRRSNGGTLNPGPGNKR